ncbi:MAG: radical SAM protein [Candidatus Hodarchaeota archaeon]
MADPFKLSLNVENQVCKGELKKYYRFRKTQFYGGCATADCLGCNLRCAYCWAQKKVWNPQNFGKFYSPQSVSEKLIKMSLRLVRVSGGEPTIGKDHLLQLLGYIPKDMLFILETNGILLNEEYIKDLSKFENIYVRLSLKGVDNQSFERNTGMDGNFFQHQLKVLEMLKRYAIHYGVAILYNLYSQEQIKNLGIPNLEYESLILYPFVEKSLRKKGIKIIQ